MVPARFLPLGLLLVALAVALAACEPADDPAVAPEPEATPEVDAEVTPAEEDPEPPEPPEGFSEAPVLAELVEAGELPPVEERLPDEPLVVEPVERVGDYGGTWHTGMRGPADSPWVSRTVGYDNLTRWNPEWTEVIPNIAASFDISDDATEFTFHLREGIRWSDGEPFTADDILFWYEDILRNDQLTEAAPVWMMAADEVGTVEKVDDHTVVFSFVAPNSLLVQRLAIGSGIVVTNRPRHYLEQFHADHNPDVDQLVAEAGVADWVELFELRTDGPAGFNRDLPTLRPWQMVTELGEGAQVVFERNPYYWKVDPEGNQLPYIDRVVFDVVEDPEVLMFKALGGELDFHTRHINSLANRAVLADNREAGDYEFIDIIPSWANELAVSLNLTHKDPILREAFQNRDFRIGLSHALNRQEIIDVVYIGQGEPWQIAPRPDSEFYDEEMAKQYTEYDVDLANEHLDRAGYAERDADGFRLRPDGQRLTFQVDVALGWQPAEIDVVEYIVAHWNEVGIDARMNTIDRSLFYVRKADNDHDANVWISPGGMGLQEVALDPRFYFPFTNESNWAIPWAYWFTGEPGAEEPPEIIQQQMDLYMQLQATADVDEQAELMREILAIAKEEFWVMGITLSPDGYGIVRNNFRNVPDVMPESHLYNTPAPTNPEQYFVEQ